MAPLTEVDKYNIACVALYFVTFVASLLLSIWELCFIRRRSDPARSWLTWLNWSFVLFTLYMALLVVAYSISVVYNRMLERGIQIPKDVQKTTITARAFIIAIYWILRNIIQILILMTLVSLDVGLSMSRGGPPKTTGKRRRGLGLALCFCLLLVTVVSFGLRCAVYAQQYGGDNIDYYSLQKQLIERWLLVKRINFSYCVVWELIAVFLFGLAAWSRILASDARHTTKASTYALVCSAILVTQTTYDLITYIQTINFQDSAPDEDYTAYLEVLDVIFNVWTWFAILCLLLSLSNMKVGGVWSTDQPFITSTDLDKMVQTPWGYSVYPDSSTTHQQPQATYDANGNSWSWPTGGAGYYSQEPQQHVQPSYHVYGQGTAQHVEMVGHPQYQQYQHYQTEQQLQYSAQYQQQQQQQQQHQHPPNMYVVA